MESSQLWQKGEDSSEQFVQGTSRHKSFMYYQPVQILLKNGFLHFEDVHRLHHWSIHYSIQFGN